MRLLPIAYLTKIKLTVATENADCLNPLIALGYGFWQQRTATMIQPDYPHRLAKSACTR